MSSSSSGSSATTSSATTSSEEKFLNLNTILRIVADYFKEGLPYVFMIVFFIFILTLFIVASFYKSDTVFLQKYRYIMMIVIPVIILGYLFLRKGNGDFNPMIVMMISTFVVILMIILFVSYIKTPTFSSKNSIVFGSYIISVILAAIFIVGLAIAYKVFKNSAKKMRGWPGFIVNLLFFIPCLVSDLIDYIFLEFKTAPNTVFVLYIIEIILILAYFYVPKLLKYINTKNGLVLQEQPVYLNKSTIVSDNSMFMLPSSVTNSLVSTDVSFSNVYNSNFGLSMWIYVNNMGLNATDGNGLVLFQIASPNDVNGKPSIRYMGNDQWNFIFNNQLIKNNKQTVTKAQYTMTIPSQKWNHVVFNYFENNVDLFINGNLERSMDLKNNPILQLPTDVISVGDTKGIHGSICNLVYYNTPLTKTKISQIYNTYSIKNPPI